MADGEWYYAKDNQPQGPVPLQAMLDMARGGQLHPGQLVWRAGMANWQPAGTISELFPTAPVGPPPYTPPFGGPGAPPTAPAMPGQPFPAGPIPYGQPPGYYPAAPRQPYPPGAVPNYLVQSILLTLLCCPPIGIVSIVYAAQVNDKLMRGDYAGAVDSSRKAKTWCLWGFGLGLLLILGYFAIMVLALLAQR
jgi:hypothetical protein